VYYLFSYDDYYPGGGMEDFRGNFATIAEAQAAFGAGYAGGSRRSPRRDGFCNIATTDDAGGLVTVLCGMRKWDAGTGTPSTYTVEWTE